jgi:chemosensory pili system protein ChpA (sensor histidine kinase/response regulator)
MDESLDLVTLSWCLGEIREALGQTEALLEKLLESDAADESSLRMARTALHQAHGALLVVDVPGVSVLTEEAEALLDAVERGQVKINSDVVSRLSAAFRAAVEYLEDLLQGQPPQPLYLFPYLKGLLEARGAERIHPADLFFPDLSRRLAAPAGAPQAAVDAQALSLARQDFEKGLLRFLREPNNPRGVDYMLAAVGAVERSERGAPNRNFWRVVLAFFDALRSGALPIDVYSKRLLARLNLQLRKTIDEAAPIADRLFKDTLFSLACSTEGSPALREVRRVYRLDGAVPPDFELPRYGRHDQRAVRAAREALVQARNAWDKVARGSRADLAGAGHALDAFQVAVEQLPEQGMRALAAALIDTWRRVNGRDEPVPEPVLLEVAMAVLFAEQMLEQGGRAGAEHDARAAELAERLRSAARGEAIGGGEVPDWLQDLSRAAQERLTMAAFVGEMLANLRGVEKELDAFFRDAGQRAALPDTIRQLHQVAGALQLLGHQDAADGAQAVAVRVAAFAEQQGAPDPLECERVASSLGALGFFVEGLQQPDRPSGHFELDRETGEFRARLGESMRARRPADDDEQADEALVVEPIGEAPSLESTLTEHTQHAEGLFHTLQEMPADPAVRAELRAALEKVRDDAVLLDDGDLKNKAVEALDLLSVDAMPEIGDLSIALADIGAGPGQPAEPSAAAVAAPPPADAAAVDEELLEIFLSEAEEVLAAIADSARSSRQAPSDQMALTTIRRGFHTLKGSSRMVGLNAFGEAGWAMEQVMNLWLAEQRTGNEALYALIDAARQAMSRWVEALRAQPSVVLHTEPLVRAADAFRHGEPYSLDGIDGAGSAPPTGAVDVQAPLPQSAEAADAASAFEPIAEDLAEPVAESVPALFAEPVAELESQPLAEGLAEPAAQAEATPVEAPVAEPVAIVADLVIDEAAIDAALLADEVDALPPVPPDAADQALTVAEAELPAQAMPADTTPDAAPALALDALATPAVTDLSTDLSEFSANMDAVIAEFMAQEQRAKLAPEPLEALDLTPLVPADDEAGVAALAVDDASERAAADAVPDADAQTDADTVRIGDTTVSLPLYMIFLGEADELISTLVRDAEDWRLHPDRPASETAMRAVHSLAGSASVVGLHGVHLIAEQIEGLYFAQQQCGRALDEDEHDVLSQVIERMQAMLHQFAAGKTPRDEPEALAVVHALRERLSAEPIGGLGTALDHDEDVPALVDDEAVAIDLSDVADEAGSAEPGVLSESGFEDGLASSEDAEFGSAAQAEAVDAMRTAIEQARAQGDAASAAPLPADEFDPDLLPIFIEEAADLMPTIGEGLRRWSASPADASLAQTLMRGLHTVKGSARMAGAMALGQHVHEMETRIEAATLLPAVPSGLIDELIADHDQAMAMFETIRDPSRAAASVAPAEAPAATPAAAPATDQRDAAVPAAGPRPDQAAAVPAAVPVPLAAQAGPVAVPVAQAGSAAQLVRVRADLLDRLVNEAGEVSIARAKLDNELVALRQSLSDLTENVSRLRTQLREIEIQGETQIQARIAQQKEHEQAFDPLEFDRYTRFQELTRMMAESVNDVATVQQNAAKGLDVASQDLLRQGQVLRELQQDLMRVRMVQFGSISDRLFRVVRQAGKETGKRVNLDVRGAGVEVDRGVLERMAGPIEHLLRNAVAHGIEPREVRLAAGKPEAGEIRVEVRQEGNEIVLIFADDGGGLDFARIRAKAASAGLIPADAQPSERELAEFIFAPGFSTAGKVTELSGRGVGMDVVRSETAALGGRIETDSVAGQGTRFTARLPLTLAVAQVVLVGVGEDRYAVPSSAVEQVLQFKPALLSAAYASGHVSWQGGEVPLFYLGALVELADATPVAQAYSPIVIVRSGNERIALHVDTVSRNQEVVVKNVGPQVSRVRGVSGATVLGNGDIVLIVNPVVLAQAAVGVALDSYGPSSGMLQPARLDVPATIMVVDDSVTVRKVTQRLLAREGFQVVLAKDGVDALRHLQDSVPDVMLVDIEMPRMDGFDLTRNVRADERLRNVPIIMITSRTADKHRNYAMSLGVDAYLGKPFDEDELLEKIASLRARRPVGLATGPQDARTTA